MKRKYKQYTKATKMQCIKDILVAGYGGTVKVAKATGIPLDTLYTWMASYKKDKPGKVSKHRVDVTVTHQMRKKRTIHKGNSIHWSEEELMTIANAVVAVTIENPFLTIGERMKRAMFSVPVRRHRNVYSAYSDVKVRAAITNAFQRRFPNIERKAKFDFVGVPTQAMLEELLHRDDQLRKCL